MYLLKGETIRPDAVRLFHSRPPGVTWRNPLATKEGQPGVAFRWLEVEGPLQDEWPSRGHRLMFGDLPLKQNAKGEVEIVSTNHLADAEALLRAFMQRAYRRPVTQEEVPRFLKLVDAALKSEATFAEALLTAYAAVLCSPAFVTLKEKPGPLDDSEVFKRLFLKGSPEEVKAQMRRLALGRSVMDTVAEQTCGLQRDLGPRDRARLDQYLTGVRDLEKRLGNTAEWEQKPKSVVSEQPPVDPAAPRDYLEKVRLMYDLARLAFETDSTRLIALMLDSVNSPAIKIETEALTDGYHAISHHGKSPDKLRQLELVDRAHMKLLEHLFSALKSRQETDQTLFDRTMVLYGTNLGDANTHVTTNLPTLFAGGGFKHGQHLAFDRERNYPLPNLFVNVLQRFGIEADKFATSTGTVRGLEMA